MGCTQSKIEQEESVARCAERKRFMSDAVAFRNAFAAAHSAYAVVLRTTGGSLSDFAHGEVPPAAGASTSFSSASVPVSSGSRSFSRTIPPPYEPPLPPPPPLPSTEVSSPLQRSVSMPDIPISDTKSKKFDSATIHEEEDEDEPDDDDEDGEEDSEDDISHHDHDEFHPVRPAPVLAPTSPVMLQQKSTQDRPRQMPDSNGMGYDYIFAAHDMMPPPTLGEPEEPVWPEKLNLDEERKLKRAAVPKDSREMLHEYEGMNIQRTEVMMPPEVIEEPAKLPKLARQPKLAHISSVGSAHHQHAASLGSSIVEASSSRKGKMLSAIQMSANLVQVIKDLDDHFLQASASTDDVSKMLEAVRMHYHSNFADSRGHIDHSKRIMRVITWNRSFKGLQQEGENEFENDEPDTHATILDKLLAWEKKLYDEMKMGEIMKIEYQKKIALLERLKKRNVKPELLEKTKAAVSHLHTRCIVDMQSMDSTILEINRLRDRLLYPKLAELVDGMARMWQAMYHHHLEQLKIMTRFKDFEMASVLKETSKSHHQQTLELRSTLKDWQLQFEKLMKNQKDYIKALKDWLKLNMIPIESSLKDKASSPTRLPTPPIKNLLYNWHEQMESLPVERARTAIHAFAEIIGTIILLQEEELNTKDRFLDTQKELDHKRRQFDDWHRRYIEKIASQSGTATSDIAESGNQDLVLKRRAEIECLEEKLKEEEENHRKLCKQARDKSRVTLRLHLPDLFRTMAEFSSVASTMYNNLQSITRQRNEVDG